MKRHDASVGGNVRGSNSQRAKTQVPTVAKRDFDMSSVPSFLHSHVPAAATARPTKRVLSESRASGEEQRAGGDPVHGESIENSGVEEPEDVADAAFKAMEEARTALVTDADSRQDLFKTAVLGGAWQLRRASRALYGVRTDIKAGTVLHVFATTVGLHVSNSCTYELYGEKGAHAMVHLWQKR
eukprot:1607484-Amphidinium_carterae.1